MQATAQYDNARTSAYVAESILSPRNVNAAAFGKVGVIKVDGDVYAQVLYLPAVRTGQGVRPVIYIATEHNSVYALDASGREELWHVNLTPARTTTVPGFDTRCPFIRPEIGITPTPVIDTTTGTMYVLARTKEYSTYVQRLHALSVATGRPKHAPVEIHAPGFDLLRENPRAALLLTHGQVILSWASSCDVGPFHGWIMAYNAKTLAQTAAFNVTPNGSDGGVWQGDAGLAADAQGHIYAATANGTFDAATGGGGHDYGDTMLQLTLGKTGFVVSDYFTPADQQQLDREDLDLGSGGPLLLPDHYLFIGGKGGGVYVLDRNDLGKLGGREIMKAPSMVMGAAAYWNNHVYTLWSDDVVKMFSWSNGQLSAAPVSQGTHKFTDPGATPTVSANGSRDGIMWVVETKTWNGRDRNAVLHAYDAANLATELYSSETNPARDRAGQCTRFNIATVARGRVYIGAKGEVDVYGLLTSSPPSPPSPPSAAHPF